MAENPIRFGIMGCATIAKKLVRAINLAPNSTLYAIASRSLEKCIEFSTANNLANTVKTYGSYEELLDDSCVDVVYMPLPTSLHVQWAVLAAEKKKHLVLEKPTALGVAELDRILEACELNGVQFMDGSMWLHHPRTAKMKQLLSDSNNVSIGKPNFIHSTSTCFMPPEFFQNNIRVKPDLDALGALCDLGWYCIGAVLWAKNYQLPNVVTALPDIIKNPAGIILSCTASLQYSQDNTLAIIYCSFLSHVSMDLTIIGYNGSLHLKDFALPFKEDSASFEFTFRPKLVDLHIGWNVKPEKVVVTNELPQESLMVQEVAMLADGIRTSKCRPDTKWPEISRKTQIVLDAVKKSVDLGCKPVSL